MLLNQNIKLGDIIRFEVYSNNGSKSIDIRSGINEFYYYESILENTIAARVILSDTGFSFPSDGGASNLYDELNLQGAEKAYLGYIDGNGFQVRFDTDANAFYVNKINKIAENTLSTTLSLELVTKEFLDNEFLDNKVVQRYDGKPSDVVVKILRENLKTKKKIFTHNTINKDVAVGQFSFPLQMCRELSARSVPDIPKANGKSAGYLFFESRDGFNFLSIDKILDTKTLPYKSYIYTETTSIPPGYTGKILRIDGYFENVDVQDALRKGTYGKELVTFDARKDDAPQKGQGITKGEQKGGVILGGKEFPDYSSIFSKKTKREFEPLSNYTYNDKLSPEEQLKNSDQEYFDIKNVITQASTRYNQIFAIQLSITIPLDASLRAGDVILCDFPEISSKKTQPISDKKSGIYMIADLCHYITPRKGGYTKLNLIRDSYGRKTGTFKLNFS